MSKRIPTAYSGVRTRQYTVDSSATFKSGAFVLLASDEEIEACGADPTAVLGIACSDAQADPVTGKVLVMLAEEHALFHIEGDNNPVAGDQNQDYGVAVDSDGIWYIDGAETSADVLHVVDVDLTRNLYTVRFVADVRQSTPAA